MFLITLNKKSLWRLGAAAACCILAAAGFLGVRSMLDRNAVPTSGPLNTTVESTQDMQAFFAGYGLETDLSQASVDKVRVPKKWDDSFQGFHSLVQQSGLDLSKCKGKTVEKWLLPVPRLSDAGNTAYAVLLVLNKKAVGAYLLKKPSGEVLGLADLTRQEQAAQPTDADLCDEGDEDTLDVDMPYDDEGFPVE